MYRSLHWRPFLLLAVLETCFAHQDSGSWYDVRPHCGPGDPAENYSYPCLGAAVHRVRRSMTMENWLYPLSFCYPRSRALYYHLPFHGNRVPYAEGNSTHLHNLRAAERAHIKQLQAGGAAPTDDHITLLATYVAGQLPRVAPLGPELRWTLYHHPHECHGLFQAPPARKLRKQALQYFMRHLTCNGMVQYMMQSARLPELCTGPVLFLDESLPATPDWMSMMVLMGLRELLGRKVHVYREPPYLYSDWAGDHAAWHNKGFGYARAINASLRAPDMTPEAVLDGLSRGDYAAVVYGSALRSAPFYAEVTRRLDARRVWVVIGERMPSPEAVLRHKGKATVFSSHLTDDIYGAVQANKPPPAPEVVPGRFARASAPISVSPSCRRPPPTPAADYNVTCFQDALRRLEALTQSQRREYPVSFCYPRAIAQYYAAMFERWPKRAHTKEGLHGASQAKRNYAFNDEDRYMQHYADAAVVSTQRKAGWDCMRHLEIYAAGALPLWRTTGGLDPLTLFHHPKECFPVFAGAPREALPQLRRLMQTYFMEHLTCDAMVHFMLRAVRLDPCRDAPVLFLDTAVAGPGGEDYLSMMILIGLRDVFGAAVHVYREPQYLYTGYAGDHTKLYGNGFGYAFAINQTLMNPPIPAEEVRARLQRRYYKLVVYGNTRRSLPFYGAVQASMAPDCIWLLNGDDVAMPPHSRPKPSKGTFFVRELTQAVVARISTGHGASLLCCGYQ